MSQTQDTDEKGVQAHRQVDDDEIFRMNRRQMMKTTATVTGTAIASGSMVHPDSPFSAVEDAEALGIVGGIALAFVAGATATAISEELGWTDLDDSSEDATTDQVHRNVYQNFIGYQSQREEHDRLLDLAVESAGERIWGDAVHQIATELNDKPEKSESQIKADARQFILDEYAKLEQEAISAMNEQFRGLVNAFQILAQYDERDQLSNIINMKIGWADFEPKSAQVSFDSPKWELIEDGGTTVDYTPTLNPLPEGGAVTQDDLVSDDYTMINGESVERIRGWANAIDFYANTATTSDNSGEGLSWKGPQGNTTINYDGHGVYTIDNVIINAPSDSSTNINVLPIEHHINQLNELENEANSMTATVGDFVNGLTTQYTRGNIPVQEIVPTATLWDEYDYKEGSAPFNAMAMSQLDVKTDLTAPMKIREYSSTNYDPEASGNDPDSDGKVYEGYLGNVDKEVQKGNYYSPSEFSDTVKFATNTGVYNIDGKFRVEKITLYKDGEKQQVKTATPDSDYKFNPSQADQWEQEYNNTEDARQAATENPEINVSLGGGVGSALEGFDITQLWPVALIIGAIGALSQLAGDK
ncbi:hypothetical protein [Halolamina sp. C58]|uniref:hypothetical protein n=1 Tax=Halolamina sp. C58 TaxID=3421640 RepID=UPI003EBB594E